MDIQYEHMKRYERTGVLLINPLYGAYDVNHRMWIHGVNVLNFLHGLN